MLYYKNSDDVEIYKPLREKLLGKEYLKSAPGEYWDMLVMFDLGYSLDTWDNLSFQDKAKILSARYVKNMIDIITSYYEEMEERLKKLNAPKT